MLNGVKSVVRKMPILGPMAVRLHLPFKTSSDYWERRYVKGGNSGVGSYGRLAHFKAEFLNDFVEQHRIKSVIEYGCGDGSQLKLAHYPSYTGIDVSPRAVEICRALFATDRSKRFFHTDAVKTPMVTDLALSLDVVYHLVEDSAFESYMHTLFDSAQRFVIIYSSNLNDARQRDTCAIGTLHRGSSNINHSGMSPHMWQMFIHTTLRAPATHPSLIFMYSRHVTAGEDDRQIASQGWACVISVRIRDISRDVYRRSIDPMHAA